MITHFLSHDFSLTDIPDCVSDHHYDNFAVALRQREISDDALQYARHLQWELGPRLSETAKRHLQKAWAAAHNEREQYDAMVQDAMEQLNNDYPYGFDH